MQITIIANFNAESFITALFVWKKSINDVVIEYLAEVILHMRD